MSIIKNKDIYDPKDGNPLEPIVKMLDILDKKVAETTKKMLSLEQAIKSANVQGSSSDAQKVISNTSQLAKETEKLTAFQKAQLSIKNQLSTAEVKLAASVSDENRQLQALKLSQQQVNQEQKISAKLTSNLTGAYEKESITLNQLRKQYKDLAVQEKGSSKEARDLLNQITKLDQKLKQVDSSVGQFQRNVGNYKSALQSFGATIKNIFTGGIILGAINILRRFGAEVVTLGGQLAGTAQNFRQLNRPDLLDKLRDATSGTVSDLELMKAALDADDFKANLDNLPLYFAYARKEVQETGGSVTELVNKLISGLGKESPKVLTQLGISTRDFKEELAKTGDYAQAVTNILSTRMKEAGTYIETASDVTARWGARWDNIKANAGLLINAVLVKISPVLEDIFKWVTRLWERSTDFIIDFVNGWIDLYNESQVFRAGVESLIIVFKTVWASIKLFFSLIIDNLKNTGKILAYTFNPKNWGKDFGKGFGELLAKNGQAIADDFKDFGNEVGEAYNKGLDNALNKRVDKLTRADFAIGGTGSLADGEGTGGGGGGVTENIAVTEAKNAASAEIEVLSNLDMFKENLNQKNIDRLNKYSDELKKAKAKDLEEERKTLEKGIELANEFGLIYIKDQEDFAKLRNEMLVKSAMDAAFILGEMVASGELTMKEFSKFMLKTALDVAERMLLISIANIWAKSIEQNLFAGIAKAAILTALVKGIFAGIKSQVMKFATGTDYVNGPGTEKSDSIPAMLSKGERVVPADVNKQLLGIKNKDLPRVLNSGISTLRMESKLSSIENHLAQSNWYLSNFEMYYEDSTYKYIKDIKTGLTHRIVKA